MSIHRRNFLQGCCAGIIAMNGARIGNLAFAQGDSGNQNDILISVFLRGGMDSLSFLVPHADPNYHIARPTLGLNSSQVYDIDGQLGLHPQADRLMELIQQGHLALIAACGSPSPTRSHFEAQDNAEYGITDYNPDNRGWLARYLAMQTADDIFSGVSMGSSLTRSLEGYAQAISMSGADGFTLRGSSSQVDDIRRALRQIYRDPTDNLSNVGISTLNAVDVVDLVNPGDYVPSNGVEYPNNSLGRTMESLAQVIRFELGLQAATVNVGGWDTHQSQASSSNPTTGNFANLVGDLCDSLHAFWSDLTDYHGRITMTVMSEFGRRLRENDNTGTDHGHAGVMLVFSSDLARGGIYGQWPGLAEDQLFERVDLQATTDWRAVLGEILVARCGQQVDTINQIFPYYELRNTPGIFGIRGVNSSARIRDYLLGKRAYEPDMDVNADGKVDISDIQHSIRTWK